MKLILIKNLNFKPQTPYLFIDSIDEINFCWSDKKCNLRWDDGLIVNNPEYLKEIYEIVI